MLLAVVVFALHYFLPFLSLCIIWSSKIYSRCTWQIAFKYPSLFSPVKRYTYFSKVKNELSHSKWLIEVMCQPQRFDSKHNRIRLPAGIHGHKQCSFIYIQNIAFASVILGRKCIQPMCKASKHCILGGTQNVNIIVLFTRQLHWVAIRKMTSQ